MSADLLDGWYVILLRPALTRGPLTAAVRRAGAIPVMVPGLRLAAADNRAVAEQELRRALDAPLVVVTSPSAVRFARRLRAWSDVDAIHFIAVGSATAAALRRAGACQVTQPGRRQDSEGLLELPLWADSPDTVGLITAPGGRNLIVDQLTRMGIAVKRADIYQRLPAPPGPGELHAIDSSGSPLAILHSSGEALAALMTALPTRSRVRLASAIVIPSSERLALQARQLGLSVAADAGSARPGAMLDALRRHAKAMAIR